jgi:8-oxo-dGTP pyrophosphatase MutT (NUDIX family)
MVPSGLAHTPEQHAAIAAVWRARQARPGIDLFDGPLCRLERLVLDSHGLHLHLSPTTYQVFIGTNGHHPQWADAHGRQVMADAMGTSVALRSSDGMLVFGRRSQRVALYPGAAHPFGGTMEPPPTGAVLDPLAEMRREMQEEIGITADDLSDLRAIALLEDRHLRQPELVYAAHTHLTAAALNQRLDLHEHTGCWLIADDASAIESALRSNDQLTPVLAGTLLAWGWRRFGEDWLTRNLAYRQAELHPVARWG